MLFLILPAALHDIKEVSFLHVEYMQIYVNTNLRWHLKSHLISFSVTPSPHPKRSFWFPVKLILYLKTFSVPFVICDDNVYTYGKSSSLQIETKCQERNTQNTNKSWNKLINGSLSVEGHYGFWERNTSFLSEPLFTPKDKLHVSIRCHITVPWKVNTNYRALLVYLP